VIVRLLQHFAAIDGTASSPFHYSQGPFKSWLHADGTKWIVNRHGPIAQLPNYDSCKNQSLPWLDITPGFPSASMGYTSSADTTSTPSPEVDTDVDSTSVGRRLVVELSDSDNQALGAQTRGTSAPSSTMLLPLVPPLRHRSHSHLPWRMLP
jgi:hypothetical protein